MVAVNDAASTRYEPARPAGHDAIVWDRGLGSLVWDVDGREYIDFTSGVLVTNIGHAHPEVASAVAREAARLTNCYDFSHPTRSELAERVVNAAGSPFDQVAFFTTGAEAIDAALKITRAATGRFEFISFQHAFHGRTMGAAGIGGLKTTRLHAGPMLPGVHSVPFAYCYRCPIGHTYPSCNIACANLLDAIAETHATGSIAAVVIEAYLGSGGGVVAPLEFYARVRDFCDRTGALLVLDEVQSGFGRTGAWFAFQRLGITPDLIVTAKGIANGLPLSAVIGTRAMLESVPPGGLGSTFGGNPVSCAAALATMNVLERDRLPERAAVVGERMLATLRGWQDEFPHVGDIRGIGMSFGIEMVENQATRQPAPERALGVVYGSAAAGLLTLPPSGNLGNVVRLAPALNIPENLLDEGLARLRSVLADA
ncbi:MAG: aspartate aminotransferase family protein [Thermomicrobiales bacterium]|nr:aspartate aminotransferase family protein [Thermomicrobiales bacterium]